MGLWLAAAGTVKGLTVGPRTEVNGGFVSMLCTSDQNWTPELCLCLTKRFTTEVKVFFLHVALIHSSTSPLN